MRRTDRLFEIIQTLRDGRLQTARGMAARLEVSTRTIWRDMATLIAGGLPVEGERGVGYILRERIDLPPLTFTPDEVEALTLGARLVAEGADPSLAAAARSLAARIGAALPASRALPGAGPALGVYPPPAAQAAARHLPALRRAIRLREVVTIDYADAADHASTRRVRPVALEFWGQVWTLAAWCEARGDFRSLRVDRISALAGTGTTLADWRARTAAFAAG